MSTDPLRADARENRRRILDAAQDVFGRGGADASTEEVAELAGVGIATVFRHFPTKAALLEEVLVRRFARLRDHAASLVDADDAGEAFASLFRHVVADAPGKIAIGEAMVAAGAEHERANEVAEQYRAHVATLLRRAQKAGAVRKDVGIQEVQALLVGTSRAAVLMQLDDAIRDRLVAIALDGLRAS
jgi:AcrR family transcriptional regulator